MDFFAHIGWLLDQVERLDWFYANFWNDGRPILISTAHCMSIVYHFLPILWCTSFLPLPSLLSLTFRQRRSSQSTNCPKQEKNRGEKKFHFFVNLVSLVGLEPGDDEMLVQQMWWLVCWMGGWLETFKVLLVTIVLLAKSSDLVKVFGWLEVDLWEALGCDCLVLCPASPHHASQPSSPPHHASPISPPCFGLTTTTQPTPSLQATPAKLEWIFVIKTARHLEF